MYLDQDSIKIFERQHARDRLAEFARHIGDGSRDETDIFTAHARAESRDDLVTSLLGIGVVLLTMAFIMFWR